MPRPEVQPRINIIEDEVPMQELYVQTMESFGINPERIQFISTADEAQQRIHDSTLPPPNLVILDLGLRDQKGFKSGITVLKDLKSNESPWRDVPVLVSTVDNRPEVEETCLRLGASAVIGKPFDIGILQQYIESILGKQE